MSLFQSNLRKQKSHLPKILNFVRIIHYHSKLFTGVLTCDPRYSVGRRDRSGVSSGLRRDVHGARGAGRRCVPGALPAEVVSEGLVLLDRFNIWITYVKDPTIFGRLVLYRRRFHKLE